MGLRENPLMRRVTLLILSIAAGGCALFLLLRVNAQTLQAYGVPVFSVQIPEGSEPAAEKETTAPGNITFPYPVPGTPLIIERVVASDGLPLGYGTDESTVGIAALVLRNVGSVDVERAAVVLGRGEEQLVFEVAALSPGTTVLVAEKDGKISMEQGFTVCYGWAEQNSPE